MKDRGSLANPAVALRDIIRGEARKISKMQDQISMGVVTATLDGVDVEVLMDGFGAGPVGALWCVTGEPGVGERVVLAALTGGQKWFVIAVAGGPQVVRIAHSASYVGSANRINTTEGIEITLTFDIPESWNSWDVQISSSWTVFEDLSATGNTFIRFRFRKTGLGGDVWGANAQTYGPSSPNDKAAALVAHAEDQTDTGTVTFVWTADAGSNSEVFAWDEFELFLQVWRVT